MLCELGPDEHAVAVFLSAVVSDNVGVVSTG
jgi:hypothetical protein